MQLVSTTTRTSPLLPSVCRWSDDLNLLLQSLPYHGYITTY